MPQVAITIGPKTYTVRCGEGEQDRIAALGAIIAQKYAQLGTARAPLESQNLLFTALFIADELSEAQGEAEKATRKAKAVQHELEAHLFRAGQENSRNGDRKAKMKAEINTLRKAEIRAREEIAMLRGEIVALREASENQHDLFGTPADENTVASALERLADKAEAAANAMETAQVPCAGTAHDHDTPQLEPSDNKS